ncbi:transporter [Vagococcus penaei]|uniref:Transporter n=1 Tax=Vagococcus penaei TaxID=633807 RepID=A0A1Q2D3N6_9ENTE|nr:cation diffusion facilitator family transporter [Vagococcus penaei]AQP52986.1 transporter [Vagococcus penaei]RSU02554.1 transporter [Vagococcus penaei]
MVVNRSDQLKQAEKGAYVSLIAYIAMALLKITVGNYANSEALSADGINNFTDTIAAITVIIGLRLSRKPADNDHRYGHWKAENVASLITSFIMFVAGFQVLSQALTNIIHRRIESPEPIAAAVGLFSAVVMIAVYLYNMKLGKQYTSSSLVAMAKDNLSDALTSIGTAIAVFASTFKLPILDQITAIVIGLVILKTAFDIFKESSFYLSDGFDLDLLKLYKEDILTVDGIKEVPVLRARNLGANIFLDVTVRMNPNLTVKESHDIVDDMEQQLQKKFNIFDIDVHVEPYEGDEIK